MKTLQKTLVAAALLSALPLAHAEGPHEFSANVAVTTDYIFRGISQTSEDPALSGGFDYGHESGFYAGFWASSIEFNSTTSSDDASIEMDGYVGYAGEAGAISYDLLAIYYAYPTQDEDSSAGGGDFDYFELIPSLSYSVNDMLSLGVTYAYSPDFFGEIGDSHYFGGSVDFALSQGFGASVAVGRQNFSDADGDYTHWSAGVSKDIGMFGFDLTYHDTNEEDFYGEIAGSRVVFTVSSSW